MKISRKILITGGMRSGKSRLALSIAKDMHGQRIFLATAQAFDQEMKDRIESHQKERSSSGFQTIEEPLYLGSTLKKIPAEGVVVIDCLTLWVNNLLFHVKKEEIVQKEIDMFTEEYKQSSLSIILITNETGWGIIGSDALTRRYTEIIGALNQRMASLSDEVILMVSGLPQWLKGKENVQQLPR